MDIEITNELLDKLEKEMSRRYLEMLDAVEFEARVAEKIVSDSDMEVEAYDDVDKGNDHGHGWSFVMLKRARIAVEEYYA